MAQEEKTASAKNIPHHKCHKYYDAITAVTASFYSNFIILILLAKTFSVQMHACKKKKFSL